MIDSRALNKFVIAICKKEFNFGILREMNRTLQRYKGEFYVVTSLENDWRHGCGLWLKESKTTIEVLYPRKY